MKYILKIEFLKLLKNRMFWLTLIAYLLTIMLALLIVRSIISNINHTTSQALKGMTLLPNEVYSFPLVWHNLTFLSKYFKIFLAVILIILVTNEYTYNTLRQNLITGLSRTQLVLSKYITASILAGLSVVLLLIFGLFSGIINTKILHFTDIISQIYYLPLYFLLLLSYLSMVIFLSFLIRKTGLVLGIILVYSYILEPILSWKLGEFGNYLPLSAINSIIQAPETPLVKLVTGGKFSTEFDFVLLFVALIYGVGFYFATIKLLQNRDL